VALPGQGAELRVRHPLRELFHQIVDVVRLDRVDIPVTVTFKVQRFHLIPPIGRHHLNFAGFHIEV
jgi:hypothetical protein